MKLEIKDLHVAVDAKEIICGLSLTINSGEVHALMGPNGSGKSTLSYAIMGHPKYKVTKGDILVDGSSIIALPPNERAKLGIFLSFQNPMEVPGVNFTSFLRTAHTAVTGSKLNPIKFKEFLKEKLETAKFSEELVNRNLNEGFSGGEKKRAEMLQMLALKPKFAILDEPDSGTDVDAMKAVAAAINQMREAGILIITHYRRILDYINPDFVHVLVDGQIATSGQKELVAEIEARGYGKFKQNGG
jgi:Fe-S cluster assembly ATP-binding protein